ncbi:MAG: hypothetical protein ACO329_11595 [Steroidobacteraceae bacterium]
MSVLSIINNLLDKVGLELTRTGERNKRIHELETNLGHLENRYTALRQRVSLIDQAAAEGMKAREKVATLKATCQRLRVKVSYYKRKASVLGR